MSKKQEVDININISIDTEAKRSSLSEVIASPYPAQEKVKVSLSVAQLAYLIKVLSEIGVIKNRNISDVIRFITQHVSTPKADNISFDSFKSKYYNSDYSTKQFCHDLMMKKLNYIRKDLKD